MKRSKIFQFSIIFLFLTVISCTKEYSLENVRTQGSAIYSLQDSTGSCMTDSVYGVYKVDSTLADSNFVYIHVNFISTGTYHFSSDTVNGMWFSSDTGYTSTIGLTTIKLKGYGQPQLSDTSSFLINNNAQGCGFSVYAFPALDYLPTINASTWHYQYNPAVLSAGGKPINYFDITVTPPIINYNNVLYFLQYIPSINMGTYYFAKNGDNYFANSNPDFDYSASVFDSYESNNSFKIYIYLKDHQPVNTTWESTIFPNVTYGAVWNMTPKTGIAKAVFTIVSVNQAHTVGSNTFQNTIEVKREIMFQETGATTFTKVADGTTWYAKGIGLIDQTINLPDLTTENLSLISFK